MRTVPLTACLTLLALAAAASQAFAGTGYRITNGEGGKAASYDVRFGRAKLFERWTAFDPAAKKFVYLDWKRDTPAPQPAGQIWDYRSGETIPLYKFPGVEQQLPIIPSIKDLKVFPLTGERDFKVEELEIYD